MSEYTHLGLSIALGRPEVCHEEVTRGGELESCDKTAVLASGAGKAFLEDAPRKPLRSYRKQARTTIRQTTSEAK